MLCWNCNAPLGDDDPFCTCGAIAPAPREANVFSVLGLGRRFEVDLGDLEERYKALSRKFHPDRFAKADPRARRISLERTIQLNDAYKIVRHPVRRAEALLELAGINAKGDLKADPAFLMEMMEQRETLESLRSAGRTDEISQMAREIAARKDEALRRVAEGLTGDPGRAALEQVAESLAKVRYYDRFLDEVEAHAGEQAHA